MADPKTIHTLCNLPCLIILVLLVYALHAAVSERDALRIERDALRLQFDALRNSTLGIGNLPAANKLTTDAATGSHGKLFRRNNSRRVRRAPAGRE